MAIYNIDEVKKLFSDRAGTRGVSSNVSPDKFNRWFSSAELKFFNQKYSEYSLKQTISDSISKWMTDPMYISVDVNGFFTFFPGMNLLHIDSMAAYLVTTGTKIAAFKTLVAGNSYTDGSYIINLTGGSGTGATAYVVVSGSLVVACIPVLQGNGYAVNNVLTGTIPVGSGFSVTVASLTGATKDQPVSRVEKNRWAANVSSTFDAPTQEFPIYTQFSNSLQFSPANLGFAKTVYLQQPIWSKWGYLLAGYIGTLTGLVGGSSYTNGTYNNVPLTGGNGNSALATITVSGSAVTSVTLNPAALGKLYQVNDELSALAANIGGTGTGFAITVSSLVAGTVRAVYDPTTSIQPRWNNDDISTIIDLALNDAAIAARDPELTNFADKTAKSQQ